MKAVLISPTNLLLEEPVDHPPANCRYRVLTEEDFRVRRMADFGNGMLLGAGLGAIFCLAEMFFK